MSWMQKLYETYDNCQSMIGVVKDENKVALLPICHTTQKAQITITIDHNGDFKRAAVVPKNEARTIIPCTEDSCGRARNEAAHPLADKLQYLAKDYKEFGGEKKSRFPLYVEGLRKWCASAFSHPKAKAVLKYVEKGCVIKDLVKEKVLLVDKDGKLVSKVPKKVGNSVVEGIQTDAFVRWEVESIGELGSKTWEDKTLWAAWSKYYLSTKKNKVLCGVTGQEVFAAEHHSAKLRNDGDKARIISSNDNSNFTFRGRFITAGQACGVGFDVTQKAHFALRWLISRQGYRKGDQAVVAWATSGAEIPDPLADPLGIMGDSAEPVAATAANYTAQDLAEKLKRKIRGYKRSLGVTDNVVVMGLDSATPGRLSITFYRELTGSDFLNRVDSWHTSCSWIHDYVFNKERDEHVRFVGAPAPKDIAEAAYGIKADDKLKNTVVERLLPCIVDGRPIPRDIVDSVVRRASNRSGLQGWEWRKALSIACALYRQSNIKEGYEMALDSNRKTRDYLYGRLLAIADNLEQWALKATGEGRPTNAARLMHRFSEHPSSTWRTIELALVPSKARLGAKAGKLLATMDAVMSLFSPEEFISDKKLTGEFLLGYHCQREDLRYKVEAVPDEVPSEVV